MGAIIGLKPPLHPNNPIVSLFLSLSKFLGKKSGKTTPRAAAGRAISGGHHRRETRIDRRPPGATEV